MAPEPNQPSCLYCERTSDEVALLPLAYRGGQIEISQFAVWNDEFLRIL